jgi:flavin reductase (DIM6/NTAB) family NADH-FMN oxidoreductase RutF
MNNALRKLLFGDGDIHEYETVTVNDKIKESVHLQAGNIKFDVSKNQWLLCLYPAVFGVWIANGEKNIPVDGGVTYKMIFSGADGKNIAKLTLDFFDRIDDNTGSLILLKLRESRIYHLNFIKIRLLYLKYYKKPTLSFDVLKAFVSAYSYPRRVRVISFRRDDYYNIFPMDLVGDIAEDNRFVFGLRQTNNALPQIMETKKMVVSEFDFKNKEVIYKLGAHHSAGPPPIDQLPFKVIESENFKFYVPEWVNSYYEITIVKTINLGSHMLLWGEIQNKRILNPPTGYLFHIHYLLYLYQKKGSKYPLV